MDLKYCSLTKIKNEPNIDTHVDVYLVFNILQ